MTPAQFKFHLQEYTEVRGQLNWLVAQYHRQALFAAIGSVAVLSWLATSEISPSYAAVTRLGWFLPAALTALLWFANYAVLREIKQHGAYSQKLEQALGDPALGGWQMTFEKADKKEGRPVRFVTALYFGALFGVDIIVGYLGAIATP